MARWHTMFYIECCIIQSVAGFAGWCKNFSRVSCDEFFMTVILLEISVVWTKWSLSQVLIFTLDAVISLFGLVAAVVSHHYMLLSVSGLIFGLIFSANSGTNSPLLFCSLSPLPSLISPSSTVWILYQVRHPSSPLLHWHWTACIFNKLICVRMCF